MERLLSERERLWDLHPIIGHAAVLPSLSVQDAVKEVMGSAGWLRHSHVFWADPCTGKSFCLASLENHIRSKFPASGVLIYEPMKEDLTFEGRMLEDILLQMEVGFPIARSPAGKRDQLTRALLALAGDDMRVFFLIDEAQELYIRELNWLRGILNKLNRKRIKVIIVMMGQRQLLDRVDEVRRAGRKDLMDRFFKRVNEFKGCTSQGDLDALCEAMDAKSEFPEGSGWTYTQLLFPRAFQAGFRFQIQGMLLWNALTHGLSAGEIDRGVGMEDVATYLAEVCVLHRQLDAPGLVLRDDLLTKAAQEIMR